MTDLPVLPPDDEGLGNSTYLVELRSLAGGPQDWANAVAGRTVQVDR